MRYEFLQGWRLSAHLFELNIQSRFLCACLTGTGGQKHSGTHGFGDTEGTVRDILLETGNYIIALNPRSDLIVTPAMNKSP